MPPQKCIGRLCPTLKYKAIRIIYPKMHTNCKNVLFKVEQTHNIRMLLVS